MNKSRVLFTIVGGAVLINPAFAQTAQDQDQQQAGEEVETNADFLSPDSPAGCREEA